MSAGENMAEEARICAKLILKVGRFITEKVPLEISDVEVNRACLAVGILMGDQSKRNDLISVHDIVQIDPSSDPVFGGCFMLVEHIGHDFVKGFVAAPHTNVPRAVCPYRASRKHVHRIGPAVWAPDKQQTTRE